MHGGQVNSWDVASSNTSWVIRNGHNTLFWKNHWIPNIDSLKDMFLSACPAAEENYPVSFYANEGEWKWDVIERILPQEICERIQNVQAPISTSTT